MPENFALGPLHLHGWKGGIICSHKSTRVKPAQIGSN